MNAAKSRVSEDMQAFASNYDHELASSTVGVLAVTAWTFLFFAAFWIEGQSGPQALVYQWATSSSNTVIGPVSLGMVLILNIGYAGALRLFPPFGSRRP